MSDLLDETPITAELLRRLGLLGLIAIGNDANYSELKLSTSPLSGRQVQVHAHIHDCEGNVSYVGRFTTLGQLRALCFGLRITLREEG